jgi:hypothetical protein
MIWEKRSCSGGKKNGCDKSVPAVRALGTQARDDVGDVNRNDQASVSQIRHNLLDGTVRHPDLVRTSFIVSEPTRPIAKK